MNQLPQEKKVQQQQKQAEKHKFHQETEKFQGIVLNECLAWTRYYKHVLIIIK